MGCLGRPQGDSLSVLLLVWFHSGQMEKGDSTWAGVERRGKPGLLMDSKYPLLPVFGKPAGRAWAAKMGVGRRPWAFTFAFNIDLF